MENIDNYLLKAELDYKRTKVGITGKELAEKINMRTNTFYIKSMNPNSFTLSELILLRDALKLKTIDDIFNLNYKEEKK
jgi:DNA-binding XRE family transcriptional regulator